MLGLRRRKGMVLDDADPDTWSAGSFFTNPVLAADDASALPPGAPRWPLPDGGVKTSAAWLIEHAGFARGHGLPGPASLSTKHTLALTNRGTACAADLVALAREVRAGVRAAFGVTLEPEPVLVRLLPPTRVSPPTPGGSACGTRPTGYAYDVDRFSFEFSQPLSWPLAALGVTPWTAHVDVGDDELAVRFGPWSLVTPLPNVEGASITGPYLPFKVLGPHVSLADRGVTFGTSWHRGVCIRFRRPVPGALPVGLLTHPAATVTVADPERLVELLERRPQGAPGDGGGLPPRARVGAVGRGPARGRPGHGHEHGHGDGRRRTDARPNASVAAHAPGDRPLRALVVGRRLDAGPPGATPASPGGRGPRAPDPGRHARAHPHREGAGSHAARRRGTARAGLDPLTTCPISRPTPGPAARPASCPPRRGAARARARGRG